MSQTSEMPTPGPLFRCCCPDGGTEHVDLVDVGAVAEEDKVVEGCLAKVESCFERWEVEMETY